MASCRCSRGGPLALRSLKFGKQALQGSPRERQAKGIATAKAASKYKGRPCTVDAETVRAEMLKPGAYPAAVAKRLRVARSAVYRLVGDLIAGPKAS